MSTIGNPVPKQVQNIGIRPQFLPLSGRIRYPLEPVESRQKGVTSLPILNTTGESLLRLRERIRKSMGPSQKQTRGNRHISHARRGRQVEGPRRRMGRRSLRLGKSLENVVHHRPNGGRDGGIIRVPIFPGRKRGTGRRRP